MPLNRILIADDHPIARSGLASLMKIAWPDIELIHASNGREAIDLYNQHMPDILLLDYRMPEVNGYEVAEHLLKKDKTIKIILLTMYDSVVIALNFLKIGGKGFVYKGYAVEEIIGAIRAVSCGEYYFRSTHEADLVKHLEMNVDKTIPKIKFTSRELEIVIKISKGMTSKQIGEAMNLSPRSIETYRYDMIRKTQVNNSMELIDYVYRVGISPGAEAIL